MCWLIAFAVPVGVWLPWPNVWLPILPPAAEPPVSTPQIYELMPGFADRAITYLGDPHPGPTALLLAIVTALGIAVWVTRWIGTLRIVRAAEQIADDDLVAMLYEIGESFGLADVPLLKKSDQIDSPCVWGVSQPVILIPTQLASQLDSEQWRLVLIHEVAHLGQRDTLRLLWYSLIRHALWWNPFIGAAFRGAVLTQEQSIDVTVASRGRSRAYSNLLVWSAQGAGSTRGVRFLGQGHLLTRLRALSAGPQANRLVNLVSLLAFVPIVVPFQPVAPYRPDPHRIGHDEFLFQSAQSDPKRLWRASLDGRGASPLPAHFSLVGPPSVSPDGEWLAYCRNRDGKEDIYVARVDGTEERRLVATPGRDFLPRWSPDGTQIVFCTTATGNWEIGLLIVATGDWRYLTQDGLRNLEPSFHPSGTRIVFSSHRSGMQMLWSMNLDGTQLVQLTHQAEDTGARYSSNGRFLAYSSSRRSKYEATLLDLQTNTIRPLVQLKQLNTGEVNFVDSDRALAMSANTGEGLFIGKVRLDDGRFERLEWVGDSHWPIAR